MSSRPCGAEAALTSSGLGKHLRFLKSYGRNLGEDYLSDSVPMPHGLLDVSQIDQQNAYFASIVAIDRAGAVEN